jgi:hypothetical protein
MLQGFFKSKSFKILFPLLAVVLGIAILKNGYEFGQWLHRMFN